MKTKVSITMLNEQSMNTMNDPKVEIDIVDKTTGDNLFSLYFTHSDLVNMLSKLCVTGELEIHNLDHVGCTMESKEIEFPITSYGDKLDASKCSKEHIPEGWKSDDMFDSQKSFFNVDGNPCARVIIRRYIKDESC